MDIEKNSHHHNAPEPLSELKRTILARIEKRERCLVAAKIVGSLVALFFSLSLVVWAMADLGGALVQSGFFGLTSLFFSDFSQIAVNLPDFLFSIAESFPIFSAAIFLGGMAAAMWSVAVLSEEAALFRMHKFFISS